MLEVIEETDKLIDVLNDSSFVKEMIRLRKKIIDEDIKIDRNNEVIKEYIKNQNIFDLHIYYLNTEINKLINNKGFKNESN